MIMAMPSTGKPTCFNTMVKAIKEANLRRHIANGNDKNQANKNSKAKQKKSLAHEDYTLYEALNVLKGLVIIQAKRTQ